MRTQSICEGSTGANVTAAKYEPMRAAILAVLPKEAAGAITWAEMCRRVAKRVDRGLFPRGVEWYAKTVQLDLEAKGLVRRVPNVSPLRLHQVRSTGRRTG